MQAVTRWLQSFLAHTLFQVPQKKYDHIIYWNIYQRRALGLQLIACMLQQYAAV